MALAVLEKRSLHGDILDKILEKLLFLYREVEGLKALNYPKQNNSLE